MGGLGWFVLKSNTIAALFVLLVVGVSRGIGMRFSSRWKYWCWMALAVFLLIPVDFSQYLALYHVPLPVKNSQSMAAAAEITESSRTNAKDETDLDTASSMGISARVPVVSIEVGKVEITYDYRNVLVSVWLGGIFLIGFWQVVRYRIMYKRMMRWSIPISASKGRIGRMVQQKKQELEIRARLPVFLNSQLSSPMIAGIRKPVLILPDRAYNQEQLEMICSHELRHFKKKDVLYKTFLLLVRTIYWFNPALYLMVREADRDIEYICDETVTDGRTKEYRMGYNHLLLSAIRGGGRSPLLFSTNFDGGVTTFKKRVRNIMYMNPRKNGACCAVLLSLTLISGGVFVGCGGITTSSVFADENQNKSTDESILTAKNKAVSGGESPTEVLTPESDFVLPDSSEHLYAEEEIAALNQEEMRIAINEIYARHGRMFKDAALQEYFEGKSWYKGVTQPDQFNDSVLTKTELKNINLLLEKSGQLVEEEITWFAGRYKKISDGSLLYVSQATDYEFSDYGKGDVIASVEQPDDDQPDMIVEMAELYKDRQNYYRVVYSDGTEATFHFTKDALEVDGGTMNGSYQLIQTYYS